MNLETLLYIIIAGIAALSLALFQYMFKSKLKFKLKYLLFALRTLSIFGIILLLINPKFETERYYNEKPTLVLAVDNSESITYLKQDSIARSIAEAIKTNPNLNARFNIETYSFGSSVSSNDTLNFKALQSNIAATLNQFGDVYANKTAPIVLLTDGNQTYGTDYSYGAQQIKQSVYPVILGDSIRYSDLAIKQLNVNRFAFLKNKFPVEIIANYTGNTTVNTELKIRSGNSIVFNKSIQFTKNKNSEIITANLPANTVGVKTYSVELSPIANEKNTVNNKTYFGVEVIDQKTKVALVSDVLHPDLGVLKKAIESNEQRSVSVLKPNDFETQIYDFQFVILYNPNNSFNTIFKRIETQNINSFIITGTSTDYAFLNKIQSNFSFSVTNETEEYQPVLNKNYTNFIIDNIDFENYPPLKSEFGAIQFSVPNTTILNKSLNGNASNAPLLTTFETNGKKGALLSGEGLWRWRAQCYLDTKSFEDFDNFLGKLVQYLSSNKKRQRLALDHKSFYTGNANIIISAQYFNASYEFDTTAALTLYLKNKTTNKTKEIPFLLGINNYTTDLSGLEPGDYDFKIKHNTENITASGGFKVLAYNVEQQFLNADITKLNALAKTTEGVSVFKSEIPELINKLLADKRYATIQKSTKNSVPLIALKYLLFIIAFSLFLEWFIRKYNGLI